MPISRRAAALAHRPARAQVGSERTLQTAACLDVERLVDRFGRHPHLRFVGEVDLESASDLLRALVTLEPILDLLSQRKIRRELRVPGPTTPSVGMGLGHRGSIAPHAHSSLELTTDRGRVTTDLASDRPNA